MYFAVSYPTADGDTAKATYMLSAVPAWALCFGFAVDTIWGRRRWLDRVLLAGLVVGGLVCLALRGVPMSDAVRQEEWLYVRAALIAVAVIAAASVIGTMSYNIGHHDPTKFDRMVTCLTEEKGVQITIPTRDAIAESAKVGALLTTVEGNPVTVSVARSVKEAETLVYRNYHSVAGALTGRLERRETSVYLFANPASPTQRQVLYDCTYLTVPVHSGPAARPRTNSIRVEPTRPLLTRSYTQRVCPSA